jgi:hypothetical protein
VEKCRLVPLLLGNYPSLVSGMYLVPEVVPEVLAKYSGLSSQKYFCRRVLLFL